MGGARVRWIRVRSRVLPEGVELAGTDTQFWSHAGHGIRFVVDSLEPSACELLTHRRPAGRDQRPTRDTRDPDDR